MKVLIILALAALVAAGPADRDKRSFGLQQYGAGSPVYQSLSNSQSSSYEAKSHQSTSLQTVLQPYQQYQQHQPLYNVQQPAYGGSQRVYAYPVRQQAVYSPQVNYYPAQTYASSRNYYPAQTYASSRNYYPAQTYASSRNYYPAQNYQTYPVRTYAPVQTYAQTYTPVQTYATPLNYYQGQTYGTDAWC